MKTTIIDMTSIKEVRCDIAPTVNVEHEAASVLTCNANRNSHGGDVVNDHIPTYDEDLQKEFMTLCEETSFANLNAHDDDGIIETSFVNWNQDDENVINDWISTNGEELLKELIAICEVTSFANENAHGEDVFKGLRISITKND